MIEEERRGVRRRTGFVFAFDGGGCVDFHLYLFRLCPPVPNPSIAIATSL